MCLVRESINYLRSILREFHLVTSFINRMKTVERVTVSKNDLHQINESRKFINLWR